MINVRLVVTAGLAGLLLASCGGDDANGADDGPAAPGPALVVSGRVADDPPEAGFDPTRNVDAARDLTPEPGPFDLVLIGGDDEELRRVPFDIDEKSGGQAADGRFQVAVQPPPTEPISRMEVRHDGDAIGAVEGSPAVPTVSIEAPEPGDDVVLDEAEFRWAGDDPDGGTDLTYAVYLSSDDGESWRSLVNQTTATELQPSSGILRPSDEARLLVSVSDGVNASQVISEPFRLR